MATATISDTTGKTIKAEQSVKVEIYNRGSKTRIAFDSEFNDELRNLTKLAVQNGCEWYKLLKKDGEWTREYIPNESKESGS